MKYMGSRALWWLATVALMVSASAHAAVVVQYHHVSDSTPPSTSITPAQFQRHMDRLAEQGFTAVPLPELVSKLKQGESLPDKTVAITFDDAYESVYTTAYPILKKRGWPFTVFVNTNPIDQDKSGFIRWEQLREMAEDGATIANHSTQHNHLQRQQSGESAKQWRKRITAEVVDAEQRIKAETGQNHKLLAYPYGEYNNQVKALLEDLDFVAFGQQSGPLAPYSDLLALPRFPFGGAYTDLDDFAVKINTRPMPIADIQLCADKRCKKPLDEVVVAEGDRPVLSLTLEHERLVPAINCFASGQGGIETWVDGKTLRTRANESLAPGRTRYNCTAASGESGRFFWFSQQWLVTDEDGNWVHED